MKKKFKDRGLVKILGSVLKGALADTLSPVLGIATGAVIGLKEGISKVKEGNINSQAGGQGKPDYVRLLSLSAIVILFILYATGMITEDQLGDGLDKVQ